MRSERRFKMIPMLLLVLLFAIVGSHNACSNLKTTEMSAESASIHFESVMSSPNPFSKIQYADPTTDPVYISPTRITCDGKSHPQSVLRFDRSLNSWIQNLTRAAGKTCQFERKTVFDVKEFRASEMAVWDSTLFRQYNPAQDDQIHELTVAVCKPIAGSFNIANSRLAGFVIFWNAEQKRWTSRLDYTVYAEKDLLPLLGPQGQWRKDEHVLLFNTSRTTVYQRPTEAQRQKMTLDLVTVDPEAKMFTGVFNYSFKSYGNHSLEIIDATIDCWVDITRLDQN